MVFIYKDVYLNLFFLRESAGERVKPKNFLFPSHNYYFFFIISQAHIEGEGGELASSGS